MPLPTRFSLGWVHSVWQLAERGRRPYPAVITVSIDLVRCVTRAVCKRWLSAAAAALVPLVGVAIVLTNRTPRPPLADSGSTRTASNSRQPGPRGCRQWPATT